MKENCRTEIQFLAQRKALFWQAVRDDPLDFADRVACRFLGATLWYVPLNRNDVATRPWVTWTSRVIYPLPFLSLLFLLPRWFGGHCAGRNGA